MAAARTKRRTSALAGHRRRTVTFGSGSSRSGPVTAGQGNMLRTIFFEPPNEEHFLVSQVVALPPGVGLYDLVRAAGQLVIRHESLRTTYVLGDPPTQVVAGSGSFDIELHDDARTSTPDTAAVIRRRMMSRPIDVRSDEQ